MRIFLAILLAILPLRADIDLQDPAFLAALEAPAAGGGPADPTILWWKLNDGAGTAINSDAGPDGTTDGTLNGDYLDLNGVDDDTRTDSGITTGVQVVSASMWIQRPSWGGGGGASLSFINGSLYAANGTWQVVEQFSTLYFRMYDSGGGIREETASVSNLPVDEFVNFVFVIDNSTTSGNFICYTNGVEMPLTVGVDGKGGSGNIYAGTVFIGCASTTTEFMPGLVDDVRIYSGTLSSSDALAIKNGGRQ